MAIYPTESTLGTQQSVPAVDVEAWTEQAVQALSSVSISESPVASRTAASLEIPLDEHNGVRIASVDTAAVRSVYQRREPVRRDSMKRREALLKGKEGSRRRQRWENGR